ncbi:MAG: tRNA (adenosine(37)-N6)-threonylcarbamoyltransferase complex ATPase subunit type 1 TsaE [Defluviitaleaceae bacterium]|nr:tRNA (adenosine(37)-N6)-threonylcarbamoyltransferase complex ATPase subunit type 1 TsaE [Defluviitaleaceae bacterium]
MKTFISHNEKDTEKIGEELGRICNPGDVFCLDGNLGAGKTVFARGFARGLNYDGRVTSPTFCIVNTYESTEMRLPLHHFDAYRLDAREMQDIGFDEYLYAGGVCLIEWGEKISELLIDIPVTFVKIIIEGDTRIVRIIN